MSAVAETELTPCFNKLPSCSKPQLRHIPYLGDSEATILGVWRHRSGLCYAFAITRKKTFKEMTFCYE